MKKSLIVLAASALILFAACKKEENKAYTVNGNQITFGVGLDSRTDDGKQSFSGEYKRIYFTSGDQVFINNAACNIIPRPNDNFPGSSNSWSPVGAVTADVSADGSYNFIYPAAIFTENAGVYSATFPAEVNLLNGNAADNRFENIPEAVRPIWPMYFEIPDIETFEDQVLLKNAVAFLSPNFIYGPAWCNVVFSPLTNVNYGTVNDVTTPCPVLTIKDVVIRSNRKLTGAAHLVTSATNPRMVMDGTVATGARDVVYCHAPANTIITENAGVNQELLNVAGILPIAPMNDEDNKTFQVDVYLECVLPVWDAASETATNTTYYLRFTSKEKSTADYISRTRRYMININFQTIGEGYTGNYRVNGDGSISFPNGQLWLQTTPFTVDLTAAPLTVDFVSGN